MTIEHLKELRDNPKRVAPRITFENKGITDFAIIQQLEQSFNNGNPFPKVLKELLFLAGERCVWLEFGAYDTQHEMQLEENTDLIDESIIISRPHYFIDLSSHDCPIFMYLDEGDNPILYQVDGMFDRYIRKMEGITLQSFIESRIKAYKEGRPVF